MLRLIDTGQNKISVTISRAQITSSSKSRVFLNLTADQVQVFDWIAKPG